MDQQSRLYLKTVILAILIIGLVVVGACLTMGYNEITIRAIIRSTAKISATLFTFAFGISSFHYFFASSATKAILGYRPHLGLTMAISHSFHLLFLLILQLNFHPSFTASPIAALTGGGIAYGFIYLMAFTTFPYFKSKLSTKAWTSLHTIGSYWLWFVFTQSYFNNVWLHQRSYFFLAILILVLVLRIGRNLHSRVSMIKSSE